MFDSFVLIEPYPSLTSMAPKKVEKLLEPSSRPHRLRMTAAQGRKTTGRGEIQDGLVHHTLSYPSRLKAASLACDPQPAHIVVRTHMQHFTRVVKKRFRSFITILYGTYTL